MLRTLLPRAHCQSERSRCASELEAFGRWLQEVGCSRQSALGHIRRLRRTLERASRVSADGHYAERAVAEMFAAAFTSRSAAVCRRIRGRSGRAALDARRGKARPSRTLVGRLSRDGLRRNARRSSRPPRAGGLRGAQVLGHELPVHPGVPRARHEHAVHEGPGNRGHRADEPGDPGLCLHDLLLARARRSMGRLAEGLKYNHSQNAQLARELARLDFTPSLSQVRFPTLVTTGRYDMNVSPLTAYRIHQAIPASRYLVFEKSSHIPFYEEPETFVAEVSKFLAK